MIIGINIIIVIGTVIISLIAFSNHELFEKLKFNAYRINHNKESWRFFTYALLHAGLLHLIINMYVLYSFGNIVEQNFRVLFGLKGLLYYVLLYVGGVIFSTLLDFRKHKNDPYYNAVGASGAVSAVVFSSILFYPGGGIFIFPIPFSIPAWAFAILYLGYSAYMGRRGGDNIGHNAHFWGAIFGVVFTVLMYPKIIRHFFDQLF